MSNLHNVWLHFRISIITFDDRDYAKEHYFIQALITWCVMTCINDLRFKSHKVHLGEVVYIILQHADIYIYLKGIIIFYIEFRLICIINVKCILRILIKIPDFKNIRKTKEQAHAIA